MTELAADGIPVAVTCRVLNIARQPYYRWCGRPGTDSEHERAHRANALFDAHRDDPEFGYRFLADEARCRAELGGQLRAPGRRRAALRRIVDADRFPGLTALQARRVVYGAQRRVVLTHSPTLRAKQRAGFDQTLSKATGRLTELATTLVCGKTRRDRAAVDAEIERICHDSGSSAS